MELCPGDPGTTQSLASGSQQGFLVETSVSSVGQRVLIQGKCNYICLPGVQIPCKKTCNFKTTLNIYRYTKHIIWENISKREGERADVGY